MTGFARLRRQVKGAEVVVSLKSVNHRGLDLRLFLPPELDGLESEMRGRLSRLLVRGHVEVRIELRRTPGAGALQLNRGLLEAYLAAFRQAAADYDLGGEPDLNAILRFPGILAPAAEPETGSDFERGLLEALEDAATELNAFREREGAEIARELIARAGTLVELAERLEGLRLEALRAFEQRLEERLRELLGGAGVEAQRLAQEAAFLAERSDISEELERLKIHAREVGQMLAAGGEVGKRLDFLLQEMHRETNTILSKTAGVGGSGLKITNLALAAKAEIEKIREQALNLE
jgi:uncharacterized protein (TIGR00255 family)